MMINDMINAAVLLMPFSVIPE